VEPRRHALLTASHNVASNKSDIKRFICFGINRARVGGAYKIAAREAESHPRIARHGDVKIARIGWRERSWPRRQPLS